MYIIYYEKINYFRKWKETCRKDNQPISFLNLGQMVGRIYKSITNDKYRQNPSYIPNWAQEQADNIRRGK